MKSTFKQRWRTMTHGRAGRRFQDRYAATRKSRNDASWGERGRRVLRLTLALMAVVIGAFLMFFPGPAIPFFFLAGALLATESLTIARLLDWIEVRLRATWRWGKRHWGNTPHWGRALLVVAALGLSAASTYVSYRLLIG
jgi:hypothetical protein